jgi:hypothetical protein
VTDFYGHGRSESVPAGWAKRPRIVSEKRRHQFHDGLNWCSLRSLAVAAR